MVQLYRVRIRQLNGWQEELRLVQYKESPTTDVRLGLCVSPGKHHLPSRGEKDSSSCRRPTHQDLFPFTP